MKRKYFFLLTLLTLLFPGLGYSGEKVTTIDSLLIELWPDYDRASVLVLLTGTLPANTNLPTAITLPIPEKAELNAVARIDSSDGKMKDDFSYSMASRKLTFSTPDLRFRLEYYFPYEVNNNERTFNFIWLSDLSVTNFNIRVQQPISTTGSLTLLPTAIDISKDGDGLTYHTFHEQEVLAGQAFSLRVNYTNTSNQLTAAALAPPNVRMKEPVLSDALKKETKNNKPFVYIGLGTIFVFLIFVWQIIIRRPLSNSPLTNPGKRERQANSKFCHNCGNPVGINNNFCKNCGTGL